MQHFVTRVECNGDSIVDEEPIEYASKAAALMQARVTAARVLEDELLRSTSPIIIEVALKGPDGITHGVIKVRAEFELSSFG